MSGLSDLLSGIGNWAESVPHALKQADQDVGNYLVHSVPDAAGQLLHDFNKDVQDPVDQWLGLKPFIRYPPESGGGGGDQLPSDEADIGGKKYKFTAEDLAAGGNVEDLTSSAFKGQEDPAFQETLDARGKGFKNINPDKLTPNEYDTLTKEASKGNKLAQEILVKGKYKEQGYPSLQQDLGKYMDPFVNALSSLPQMAKGLQTAQDLTMMPYDFTNADNQVNKLLGQTGVSQPPGVMASLTSVSPQTQSYANQIGAIVGKGANELTNQVNIPGVGKLPSIEMALSSLGPAAKLSEGATPYEALLGALLSHQQYEDIYQGAFPSGKNTGSPNWLQQLIASITGQSGAGNFNLPGLTAAATAGAIPGNTPQPPGTP